MTNGGAAVWDMTLKQEYATKEQLIKWLKANCKEATFQLERGDTGYMHWQGRFSLLKKRCKNPLMNLFKSHGIEPPYLSITSNENRNNNFYVLKEDTRIEGPFIVGKKEEEVYIPRQFRDIELYPWQQQIIDSISVFETRTINYIYDEKGNLGKSTLASIATLKYGGINLPPLNDVKEIMGLLCNICMDKNLRNPGIVFIDMPRAMKKEHLNNMYSSIELVKTGMLYDTRYHYKSWWIDSPQIWVFSNKLPELTFMSLDRWAFWKVEDKQLRKLTIEDIEITKNEYSELE